MSDTETIGYAEILANPRAELGELIELRAKAHGSMAERQRFLNIYDNYKELVAKGHPNESSSETRRGVLQWILGSLDAAIRVLVNWLP